MYIVFEGMPCTGKTTLAKQLAECLNAHYMKSVLSDTLFGNNIKRFRQSSPIEMDYFYLIDGVIDELRLRDLLKTKSVIRDKCHIASVAHLKVQGYASQAYDVKSSIEMAYEQLSFFSTKPDLIVFFEPNLEQTRKHILDKDDRSQIDIDIIADTSTYIKQSDTIKSILKRTYDSRFLEIQSFSMTVTQLCDVIKTQMQELV